MQKVLVWWGRQNASPQWLSSVRRHIGSNRSQSQAQTNSPSASPADPPFAPGIELGLPHYTVAMGTLTPPLTKWELYRAACVSVCVCVHVRAHVHAICELWTEWKNASIKTYTQCSRLSFIHSLFSLYPHMPWFNFAPSVPGLCASHSYVQIVKLARARAENESAFLNNHVIWRLLIVNHSLFSGPSPLI